jgi:RNA polymerase sigma-70 factor, ECF subfamily
MLESTLDFKDIYTDYYPKIHRYLVRLVGPAEAEDLAQEVFLKISQSLPTFRGESKSSTWIFRIATNAALDKLRSPAYQRMVQEAPWEEFAQLESEAKGQAAPTEKDPLSVEQQLLRKQRTKCYLEFIKKLPMHYRLVVALSEWEGMVANEIADILGLSVDTVKIRLHRGRIKLLQEIKCHCKPEDWL